MKIQVASRFAADVKIQSRKRRNYSTIRCLRPDVSLVDFQSTTRQFASSIYRGSELHKSRRFGPHGGRSPDPSAAIAAADFGPPLISQWEIRVDLILR